MKYLGDLVGLAGLSMLGYGLHLYRPWVAFAVVGALMLAGGVMMARK